MEVFHCDKSIRLYFRPYTLDQGVGGVLQMPDVLDNRS